MSGTEELPVPPIPPTTPPPQTAAPIVNSVALATDGKIEQGGRLWMRKWMLTVGTSEGDKAQDLSQFDFEFHVEQDLFQHSWTTRIKIWNLGSDIIAKLVNKEYQSIVLWAGYQAPSQRYGKLFAGQINYFRHGRQNATDTFIEVFGLAYDIAINATVVNTWVPAGHTTADAVKACVDSMAPNGVDLGKIPEMMYKDSAPRGRVIYGNPRDHLRDIAATANAHTFVDTQGKNHILTDQDILNMGNQTVPIINVDTGMVDVPTRTMDGAVEVTSLLNPSISPGMMIRINNKDTRQLTQINTDMLDADAARFSTGSVAFNAEGYYPVGHVKHEGETRGSSWHTHLVCQSILTAPPPTNPVRTLGG